MINDLKKYILETWKAKLKIVFEVLKKEEENFGTAEALRKIKDKIKVIKKNISSSFCL